MNKRTSKGFLFIGILSVLISFSCKKTANDASTGKQFTALIKDTNTFSKSDTSKFLKYKKGVRSILEDRYGNIWFGSHQEGLCKFDGISFTYYTMDDGLCNNQIRSIFEDESGRVWFEGGEGISSYNGTMIITHHVKNYQTKFVWKSEPTDLWFKGDEIHGYNGTEGRPGVYRYDGKELSYHTFPFESAEGDDSYYSISTPFQKGKEGRFWFGAYGVVIGLDNNEFTIIDNKKVGLTEETGYLHVRSILEDSQGNLWIGNNGIGVLKYDGNTVTKFSEQMGLISKDSGLSGGYRSPAGSLEHVFAIGEDKDGNIWFGDRDTGAWRYDGKAMQNFTLKGKTATTNHISQIYTSKSGELWLAMGDGKVLRFNGEDFDRIF